MKVFEIFEMIIDKVASVLQVLSNIMVTFMMLIICSDVFTRTFFNKPILGTFELVSVSSALLVFLALANTHKFNEHITIGFIVDSLSNKPKKIVEFTIEMINFTIVIIMSYQMYLYGFRQMERNLVTSDLGIPNYIFIMIGSFGALIFSLYALVKAVNILRERGRE